MKRVAAPERTRERLRALMDGRLGTAPARSNLVLLAAQLIVEEALEAEVRDEVGRERYERADGEASGYRNGYRTGRMKTAEGVVEFAAPQVRDTAEPFVSGIRQNLAGRTGALEDLAVELYARGLSTRDIEDAFTDEAGRRLLSRAAVSEITERLWAEYEAFTTRDLSEYRIVYLFVDGIAERLRAGQAREPVLAAWGIGEEGGKVLLHLMAGSKEDTETVRAFFQDMRGRGLGDPLLVVSDGAPGIIGRSRSASRAPRGNAVSRIGCATLPSRSRLTCGRSSRRVRAPVTKPHREPSLATSPRAFGPITARCCRARSPASRTTSRPASPT